MSSVIKSNGRNWSRHRKEPVVVEFQCLIQETFDSQLPEELEPEEVARRMVIQAEAKAREIIEAAQARSEEIKESARQEGFTQGMEEAESRWNGQFAQLQEEAEKLRNEHEEILKAAEPELAKLSLEIARKILRQEITQTPDVVLSVVRSAIHRVKDKQVRILVNPKDLETVRDARETFVNIVDGVSEIDIVSDRRVGQGGCVLETPSGNLDARVETQLAHIEEVISKGYDEQQETV